MSEHSIGERWARAPKTGKAYEVPKDMTYRQWKQKYVDKGVKSSRNVKKTVEVGKISAIIEDTVRKGGRGVYFVTRLDIDKYRCISNDITTDEVIITNERIRHIMEHHPGHFELIQPYLKDVLEMPQYILEDAPNTGLVLKSIEKEGLNIKVILRIHTSNDPDGFKNSIISAWHIRDKEFRRLIRNKKILYKQE